MNTILIYYSLFQMLEVCQIFWRFISHLHIVNLSLNLVTRHEHMFFFYFLSVFTSQLEYWNSGKHGILNACAWWREFVLSCNLNTSLPAVLNSSYTIFATSSNQTRCERVNETQWIALTVTALLLSWLASWGFGISFWRRGALFYDPTGWILGLIYPARRLIT
jgi:hypothetical protein